MVIAATSGVAHADDPPRLVLGPPPVDEILPTGRAIVPPRPRPPSAQPACSFRASVCVHAPPSVPPETTLWTLRWAEDALRTYDALGLPRPLSDGALGGTPAYDLYLDPTASEVITVSDLVLRGGLTDRQSAFTVLPPPSPRAGCAPAADVARAIARAVVLGIDAGAEEGALAMTSSWLSTLAAGCSTVELAAVDDFQRRPERSLMAGAAGAAHGSLLFPWYLDDAHGTGSPGAVITGLLTVASQRTPPGAWAWKNEPDLFDALRANARARKQSVDDLLLDFAIDRAFVGSRSDEMHLTDAARFGDFGRVAIEWSVPWSSLPRRFAPARPIEATGATYYWIDVEGAPPNAELTLDVHWELPSLFRWAMVRVDKNGAEQGRQVVGGVYGDSHAQKTDVNFSGLAGILVVGVNAGSVDRAHPYDPDEEPLMPHSYAITFAP